MATRVMGVRLDPELIERFDNYLGEAGAERAEVVGTLIELLLADRLSISDTPEILPVAFNPLFPKGTSS